MVFQFSTYYSKDGMVAVTLQIVEQKFRYIVDDIAQHKYETKPLDIVIPQDLYDEIISLSERCWPCTEELYMVKLGFHPISVNLRKLLVSCRQQIIEKEPVLQHLYSLRHAQ